MANVFPEAWARSEAGGSTATSPGTLVLKVLGVWTLEELLRFGAAER
jgi:hypothetical protein